MTTAYLPRIDAHAHWDLDGAKIPESVALLRQWGVRIHNVCVAGDPQGTRLATRRRINRRLHETHPETFAWTTSFDPWHWDRPGFVSATIAQLEEDFRAGAVGLKIWRSLGMNVRKPDGVFLMMDDPLFDPIYEFTAAHNRTLLVHIGEPKLRWLSEEERRRPIGLYRKNSDYSRMTEQEAPPGCPGLDAQIAARDRVVEKHPRLRVVGAHLGSLEYDVREVAQRLDRYPNFAVDTSGRRRDLASQDQAAVREFILRYQDRILWGMDQGTGGPLTAANAAARWEYIERSNRDGYRFEFDYYETTAEVTFGSTPTPGLALPPVVLRKIYRDNAQAWYPGIFAETGARPTQNG